MQDEIDVGVALDGFEQGAHDNARAGVATHGIYRNCQSAGHGHLSRFAQAA
jgi:hypothetical protein